MMAKLRAWARIIKQDVLALYLAGRDPRVPWYAKALAMIVAGYAISPIDLIPDFIPVLGYLDDVVLLPLGVYLVVKLIPAGIMAELRARAADIREWPVGLLAAALIVCLWIAGIALVGWYSYLHLWTAS
jgi:uncharacterized membrane protein YkvA (DUF1232 family)